MWKTEKGRGLIDRIAQKKGFWKKYGDFGLIVVSITMVIIFLLVAWSAYVATSIPSSQAPEASEVLAIPGLNPLIPIWYGILGLAIAIIVHEFSHGILFRVFDVKLKALGLIFIVVPLGAFAEPDEDELEEVDKRKRGRMYAAGPTTNIVLSIVVVLIFSTLFMGAVSAKEDGVVVSRIIDGTPAAESDLQENEQILKIGDERIRSNEDFNTVNITPMEEVEVKTRRGDTHHYHNVTSGLVVGGLVEDHVAQKADLQTGDIITSMDDQAVKNYTKFADILEKKDPGETIHVTFHRKENGTYENDSVSFELDERNGEAFMGIRPTYLGITTWDVEKVPQLLSSPYEGAEGIQDYFQRSAEYMALPFLGLSPLPDEVTELYTVNGPLSALPNDAFWTISNSLYWVFWLNLLVGLFNSLPAIPLDGGHMFNDGLEELVKKLGFDDDKSEKVSSGITWVVALSILFMLMWQMIGPRI
ncbi:MAG: site-2 protease family protein [Candidatus Thermoplasmatota archaeon]|nr:site-2 protease family protein [Candidatus Thermoplasmatota archaeon]